MNLQTLRHYGKAVTFPRHRRSARQQRSRLGHYRGQTEAHIESLEDRTLLSVVAPAAQTIVYNQTADYPGSFNYWISSTNNAVNDGALLYDNFLVSTTSEINNVVWQGLYEDATPANNPANPNTGFWRISIWNDNGFGTGPGGNLLHQEQVAASQTASEFVAFTTLGSGVDVPVYNFSANLSSSFEAGANTIYWLSVFSIAQGANNPVWSWMSASGGDNATIQQAVGGSQNVVRNGDRAFRLAFDDSIGQPPATPSNLQPQGTVADETPTFSWSSVADADHYDLWVNFYGSNELVIRNQNVVGTSFTPTTGLPIDRSYIWTVRAVSAGGQVGEWATYATFDIGSGLSAPVLNSPVGSSGPSPTFSWSPASGASRYDIWVNVYGSNQQVIRNSNVSGTTFTPSQPLTRDQTYIWTVRALNAAGAPGEWAAHRTFVTDRSDTTIGTTPEILIPITTTDTVAPTFRWTAVAGATQYDIWVNVFGSNKLVLRDTNVAGTSYQPVSSLQEGETYIWTVRALTSNATSDWADHRTFRVDATAALADGTFAAVDPFTASPLNDALEDDELLAIKNGDDAGAALVMTSERESDLRPIRATGRSFSSVDSNAAGDRFDISRSRASGTEPTLAISQIDDVMRDWNTMEWWVAERRQRDRQFA